MSTLLKDQFSASFFSCLCDHLAELYPAFGRKRFLAGIYTEAWKTMELKQRMRHATLTLHHFLPADFSKAAGLLCRLTERLKTDPDRPHTFAWIFLPDYIEVYGLDHFKTSVKAMECITQFISCEYAVRPFIIRYGDRMTAQMLAWTRHQHDHVRRLASEGIRPRLPWAMALPVLKKDPSPILPILENLKTDPSLFVRKSVANNLNDISKDNPATVTAILKKWKGLGRDTDWILKHASRTLLKRGDKEVLKYFGVKHHEKIEATGFTIHTPEVKDGGDLVFSFSLVNNHARRRRIRLEYALYYRKANGHLSKKVFKISEKDYAPSERMHIKRKQSFRPITTRVYHKGLHKVALIVNGNEKKAEDFYLV